MATVLGLNVKFAANTAGISKGARQTAKQLDRIQTSAKQAASAMRTMVAIKVGELFSKAASSISGFVSNIRGSVGELTKLAQISNTTVERFQGLAAAASLVGIEQDKLADIFKDVGDRVGDFLQTGGGPMADFFENIAPMVGVTAEQFARLSGPEALQLYVDSLQKAGLSQAEMTFYLEAMSSDLTALQPLLENGSAGFEEMAARAERLGIVLSEDQTDAIKQMNASLGLVYETFEGIIAQVTANLAPAITAIAEEFLQFVEGYEGLGEGTGGTALADSITQALFDGANYLADVLDSMVPKFENFVAGVENISTVFEYVAKTFYAVAEVIRGIFNAEQVIGSMLFVGMGKLIEYLGSWVSDDLEKAGREFAESSREAMRKNATEAGDAFANASGVIFGGDGRESSEGMFSEAVQAARERFAERSSPEARAAREAQRAQQQADREHAEKLKKLAADLERAEKQRADALRKRDEEIAKKREDIAKAEAEYAARNAEEFAKVNTQALKVSDIRSGGIDQVLALATGREDPAVVEARKQVAELQAMRASLKALEMMPVELAGAA